MAPNGTVYVAYMVGPREGASGDSAPMRPAVAVSQRSRTVVRPRLDAARAHRPKAELGRPRVHRRRTRARTVYVTWDYGPRRDEVRIQCPPIKQLLDFSAGDFNAVLQKSDRRWKNLERVSAPISPGFPPEGVYSAPIRRGAGLRPLTSCTGSTPTNSRTFALPPGNQYFTSSRGAWSTWSPRVAVGAEAGTIGLKDWWIDGSLACRRCLASLYATWDSQQRSRASPPGSPGRGTVASIGLRRCACPRVGPATCPRLPRPGAATSTLRVADGSFAGRGVTGPSCAAFPSARAGT